MNKLSRGLALVFGCAFCVVALGGVYEYKLLKQSQKDVLTKVSQTTG